jgi:hypothetical protein
MAEEEEKVEENVAPVKKQTMALRTKKFFVSGFHTVSKP